MSDMCIPDLMKLNSYWQKAVEDAIRDTVKGEEKLQNALRNRKKINEKLKMLGFEPVFSGLPHSKKGAARWSGRWQRAAVKENHEMDSDNSSVSLDEESLHLFDSSRSKSSGTPFEDDEQKSPIRPMFGNGSLEKIKRSQNSFNFEPMGEGNSDEVSVSESEKDEEMFSTKDVETERNKNIQWLHVRDDRDFERSDSDSSSGRDDGVEAFQLSKHPFAKINKFLLNRPFRPNLDRKMSRTPKKHQNQDLLSDNESNITLEKQKSLKRRLELALAKREIINKKRIIPGGAKSKALVNVSWSAAKEAEKQTKGKKQLSTFIRFYLDVYRELCLKMPVKQIAEEAAERWRAMSAKEKAKWADGSKPVDF